MKPLREKISSLFLHPAFLAFPVAALLILLLPDRFSRYEVKLIDRALLDENSHLVTHDLDHDGCSERINYGSHDLTTFVTINNANRTIDQWNFNQRPETFINRIITGDANHDGTDELYVVSHRADSLFLSAIDILQTGKFLFYERFFGTAATPFRIEHNNYNPGMVIDLDGDQSGEVVFIINNGYGKFPRRLFAYDRRRDSMYQSPELGANLAGIFKTTDLNGDKRPEFLITNYASANYKDTVGIMHDHAAYLIVLDHRLQFFFPPVKFPGDYVNVEPFPFQRADSILIMCYYHGNLLNAPDNNKLLVYDQYGNKKQEVMLPQTETNFGYGFINFKEADDQFFLFDPTNKIYIYSNDLQHQKSLDIPIRPINAPSFDIDRDGHLEAFALSTDYEECLILRHNLKHTARFKVTAVNAPFFFYPWQESAYKPPGFVVVQDKEASFYTYTLNPWSYVLYVIHLGIYAGVLGFVLLVRRLQRNQLRKKYETEQQIAELKLLSIYNQINPHFTFNVLNTIGSVILQQKPEAGYELLMKFSRMIRNLLNSSNSIVRSLKDELEFATDFLGLQQARSGKAFSFEVQQDKNVDENRPVPKMVIQTHVENAVKHGIIPLKTRPGHIRIALSHSHHQLEITITDNGVGRREAAEHPVYSTGKGLAILQQTYQLLNQRNSRLITQTITDLTDEAGHATGTAVHIALPDDFAYTNIQ